MKLLIEDPLKNLDQWLALKRNTIGSSEIAVLCGLNTRKTPLELWAEKTGKVPPFEGNDATWLGQKMEPIIGEFFGRRNSQITVRPASAMYGHDEIDCISATPDFWLEREEQLGILEAKNTSYLRMADWEANAPTWAQVQLQWQMGICGIQWGFVAGMIGANTYDFKEYEFEFSKEVFEPCVELALEFMDFVRKDIPPAAKAGDKKLVEKIVGDREKGKTTALSIDSYPVVKEYLRIMQVRKELEAQVKGFKSQEDGLQARILQLMGNAEKATTEFGVSFSASNISVPPRTQNGYSYTRLFNKGELIEQPEEAQ